MPEVDDYASFLEHKRQLAGNAGFDPGELPSFLFDFQRSLTEWAIRKGRGALFADCGLGKSPMELVWCDAVRRHTDRPVLIGTPLAVAAQLVEEGAKFGIEVRRTDDGTVHRGINVTNYQRLHLYNPQDFAGMACDESSAIKSFDGALRQQVTDFMRKMPYRLLSTATAAPNDYIELGTSSEALGYLGHMDMLNRFFKNDIGNSTGTGRAYGGPVGWRFKGHAESEFWRWVCSWARALRRPSDLGFDDARFVLPALVETQHDVKARTRAPGMLFEVPASGLFEERQEQRRTIAERCERVAELVNGTGQPAVVWCHLNDEGETLRRLIHDAREVRGSDTIEDKEAALLSFSRGQTRVLITKPKIGAFGLNWQHCAHMTFFPSHSFEQYYQAVRRCWRFGQTRPVVVDVVTTDGSAEVLANLRRKAAAADAMFSRLVAHMNDALHIARDYNPQTKMEVPAWMSSTRS